MFLEKLEIQGFKSFATKNQLVFPGLLGSGDQRGITAIVGPNGSGKSNIADAIRWALGEQSVKSLRGKKSEDVIFAGTEKKGKLGMAEVSLFLDNQDRKIPIDYTELVITRRLYRSGESEYLINNSRVRLSDVHMLLAKANFGSKTYSVVGQGTVDSFLSTSLAERKEFFDEATGVKQYQIKRDSSLSKLKLSFDNLGQAQMILAEIEPRLKSLTRQVAKLQKREELQKDLHSLQVIYYSIVWEEINGKFNEYNRAFLDLEKIAQSKDEKLGALKKELEKFENESIGESEYSILTSQLSREQTRKDEINRKIARIEAQIEMKLEAQGNFDLSFLLNKQEEIRNEKKIIEDELGEIDSSILSERNSNQENLRERGRIDGLIGGLNAELSKLRAVEKKEEDVIGKKLNEALEKLSSVKKISDLAEIERLIVEIEYSLRELLRFHETGERKKEESGQTAEWQRIMEEIGRLATEKEAVIAKINENNLRVSGKSERARFLRERIASFASELASVEKKLRDNSVKFDFAEAEKEKSVYQAEIATVDSLIAEIRGKIALINENEEKKRAKIFSLQREFQAFQSEANEIARKLSDIKVNAARYETRLEDLENEIREELGSLREIKENAGKLEGNVDETRSRIHNIKRQLEQIGGIDPQVEIEYKEAKDRFEFISTQAEDLEKTIDSLQDVIKELDVTIKEKFDREFKLIAAKFEEYFKILFGGGTARLTKVTEEEMKEEQGSTADADPSADSGQEEKKPQLVPAAVEMSKIKFLQKHDAIGLAGIEIYACPPGKKIISISMLSGGERALTAIALICAIISANPAPFVVLDEVDAALDEANSERLAKILDDLSHKTQFIVITHNRAPMKRANVLYGVTMGDDGISKLLSIKMEDAEGRARNLG